MDGRITGGSVTFLKRVNRGNYEHEEASVKLDFAMNEDGTDHTTVLDRAQAEAKVGVLVQLGPMKAEVAPVAPLASSAPATASAQSTARTTGRGQTKAAASAAKEEPSKPDAAASDDPLAAAPPSTSSPATDTAAAASTGDDPLGSVSGLTASTPSTDDLTAQREVSDNDLQTALAKKNEALIKAHGPQGTMKIRDLMGRFVAPGKTVREIPQSDRASFLAQLEALA